MPGMNRFEYKDRRKERRRNHIAKDLRQGTKYAQQVVPSGRTRKWLNTEDEGFYFDDDIE